MFAVLKVKMLGYRSQIPLLIGFLIMMLVFTFIFGSSFSSGSYKPTVYIVDKVESNVSKLLITKLEESHLINTKVMGYDEAVKSVENSKGIGAVIIEQDAGEAVKLSLMNIKQTNDTMMVQSLLRSVTSTFKNDMKLAEITYSYLEQEGVSVDKEALQADIVKEIGIQRDKKSFYTTSTRLIDSDKNGYDSLKHSLAGFSLFFTMFLIFFGIGSIIDEKNNFVWQRQLVSPIKNNTILSANMIATFIVGFINIIVMVYAGKYLFHIDWGKSDIGVLLILGTFIFSVTCLGLFVSSFMKNQQQLSSITPVILVSTSMLGGCMWPLEMIQSKALLFLASLTPQKWALEGIKKMIMYGHGIEAAVMPVLVLLGMGLIYLVLGVKFIRN